MRVSEHFGITKSQAALEFVDVNTAADLPVFISPRAIDRLPGVWGRECSALIQSFFSYVLNKIKTGEDDKALEALMALREPNETHLGLSTAESRGRALGPHSAEKVWRELSASQAAKSGLLKDLEDTVLLVPGISDDIVSDITTNIIRQPLIHFTRATCERYGIPMSPGVATGPMWDPARNEWFEEYANLPIAGGDKLLLVPKNIVRQHMSFRVDEYYRHYILTHLQDVELQAGSALVETLRDGRRRVTKKSLAEKYGQGKTTIIDVTRKYPGVLDQYRLDKDRSPNPALEHEAISDASNTDRPQWDALLDAVVSVRPGRADADVYEKAIEELLTALFYPNLILPQHQHEIHQGRKRIDITYTNACEHGFFRWLGIHYPAPKIFVECKNYSGEVGNPELDQLAGRFSPRRGQVGLLVCRQLDDKRRFIERCRDTADDGRGYIIPLDDDDLRELVEARKAQTLLLEQEPVLQPRFSQLVD